MGDKAKPETKEQKNARHDQVDATVNKQDAKELVELLENLDKK